MLARSTCASSVFSVSTVMFLTVAVPAVLGYNWLVRRNKAVIEQVNAFGSDLHAVLLASGKK